MQQACQEAAGTALSWPSAPHDNAFIDTACGMFSDLGMTVRAHNPTFWNTPVEKADLYVIHWPDAIFWGQASQKRLWFWIGRILTNLALLKARGTRILWFVHNLQPHDLPQHRQRAWNVYAGALARLADGWITLSPSTDRPVKERYPALARTRHTHIWHPPYENACGGNRAQARTELGLPTGALVYGHAGLLRPYKNLVPLAERFDALAPDNAVLLLAGMAKDGVDTELNALRGRVHGLDYRDGALSASDFDRALTAMDVFITPYGRFLHSGALVHALSRGCVVVAPHAPFTADLKMALGEDWVVLYEDSIEAAVLERAAEAAGRTKGRQPDLSALMPSANEFRLSRLLSEMGLRLPSNDATGEHLAN